MICDLYIGQGQRCYNTFWFCGIREYDTPNRGEFPHYDKHVLCIYFLSSCVIVMYQFRVVLWVLYVLVLGSTLDIVDGTIGLYMCTVFLAGGL